MLPTPDVNFRRCPVTLIVTAVCVALELVCTLDEPRRLAYYMDWKLGLLSTLWQGELWQPFTPCLLHGDIIHAAFNMYWLAVFGPVLEGRLGSFRFLAVVILLGYVSMMPEFVVLNYHKPLDAQTPVVGFSGIGYGLFGMLWVGRRWHRELAAVCDTSVVQVFAGWFVICIVLTYTDVLPVANLAHAAGCAFGALYGLMLFAPRHRVRGTLLAAAGSALVLATLVICPGHNGYEHVRDNGRLWWHLAYSSQ